MIDYARIASPLGDILAAAEHGAIIGLWFEGQKYFPDISGWRENAASPPKWRGLAANSVSVSETAATRHS